MTVSDAPNPPDPSDKPDWPNLVAMFLERAGQRGDRPFLWAKEGGVYRPRSWRAVADETRLLARGLRAAGIGDGERVLLLSENRPEWAIADLAVMAAGGVTVPAYTTSTADDLHYLLTHSGAAAAIVSTEALAKRLLAAAADAPALRLIVAMTAPTTSPPDTVALVPWSEMIDRGRTANDDVDTRVAAIGRRDLACVIYTSGTGGRPKGVMLSHAAILANIKGAHALLAGLMDENEVFLSFLPLSHSYEHTGGLYFPISIGAEIYYAERTETLTTNLIEARPTIMTCVPRLYEVMRHRILIGVARAGGAKKWLFETALDLGRRRYRRPGSLGVVDRALDRLVDRLVRDKVRARFGGRVKALVSGGAPLNPDVGLFFVALGLPLLQGYGQTETAPVVSVNRPERNRIDTVGPPLAGVAVRIAEDGEILVRGDLVMDGYWNDDAATKAAFRDGWLHTGDIGAIDDDGCLRITDRKKDIIVNSGGDNIAPQRIEGLLALEPEIAQAMVHGDRRPHLVALIVPNPDLARGLAGDEGKLRAAVGEAVARANRALSSIERVKRFALAAEPFSIDNGEMTPTQKIRRHVIGARYRELLEGLY